MTLAKTNTPKRRAVEGPQDVDLIARKINLARSGGDTLSQYISKRIEWLIREQWFEDGQLLPSHRRLAQELGVHPLTVNRCYRDLQARGLVQCRRGAGTVVTRDESVPVRFAVLLPDHWPHYVGMPHLCYCHQQYFAGMSYGLRSPRAEIRFMAVPYQMSKEQIDEWVRRLSARWDGVLTMVTRYQPLLEALGQQGVPAVMYYATLDSPQVSHALFDRRRGVFLATEHLIKQGRRRIGLLSRRRTDVFAEESFRGYLDALEAYNVPYYPDLTISNDTFETTQSWDPILDQAVRDGRLGDGLVAEVDRVASMALPVLQQHGVRVPDDVALVGFDEPIYGAETKPSLTWVYVPRFEMGCQAVHLLMENLRGKSSGASRSVVQPRLIPGQSCGGFSGGDGRAMCFDFAGESIEAGEDEMVMC